MKTLVLVVVALAAPALAAERTLPVTDFDKVRVDGGFIVDIVRGRSTSVVVSGSQAAVEAATVVVQGQTLTIRRARTALNTYATQRPEPARVRIVTPALANVSISGPATVTIDRMQGLRSGAVLEGAGSLKIAALAADRFDLAMLGSGRVSLAGAVATLRAVVRGTGDLDAAALVAADATLTSESAGTVTLGVKRSITVTASGAGDVTVLGKPACTVTNTGSGSVICGVR
jgi:hypothetical protein